MAGYPENPRCAVVADSCTGRQLTLVDGCLSASAYQRYLRLPLGGLSRVSLVGGDRKHAVLSRRQRTDDPGISPRYPIVGLSGDPCSTTPWSPVV
jgi:hypothetical protein